MNRIIAASTALMLMAGTALAHTDASAALPLNPMPLTSETPTAPSPELHPQPSAPAYSRDEEVAINAACEVVQYVQAQRYMTLARLLATTQPSEELKAQVGTFTTVAARTAQTFERQAQIFHLYATKVLGQGDSYNQDIAAQIRAQIPTMLRAVSIQPDLDYLTNLDSKNEPCGAFYLSNIEPHLEEIMPAQTPENR